MKLSRIFYRAVFLGGLCVFASVGCVGEKRISEDLAGLVPQQVRVAGRQFAWDIVHAGPDGRLDTADDIAAENEITLMAGSRVDFEFISKDVIHGFWVPSLDVRQVMIPGARLKQQLIFTKPGRFKIACSELCGVGHAKMAGWVRVLPEAEYQEWLSRHKALISQRLGE
jgi:heme/copper-type cytochrome/quinol oxidase subunit 2